MQADMFSKTNSAAATRAYKRADKHVWTSEAAQNKGNQKKFEKYQGKASKQMAKHFKRQQVAEAWTSMSEHTSQKISDINSGKLKAGRDFIVQSDVNVWPIILPVPGGVVAGASVRVDRTLIERPKD
jgi:hypothetical protein